MEREKGYHRLIVWQRAKELVKLTYKVTAMLPRCENFVLVPQMRRAAISVVSNIVEGHARSLKSNKEFLNFLSISDGSLVELETQIELARMLYPNLEKDFLELENLRGEVAFLLYKFTNAIKER